LKAGEGYLELSDGDLSLSQISRMSKTLPARLAVFSSCRSGFFGEELIDEAVGLPVAFLQLGVPGVVATLWNVEDMAAACFMEFFYRFHLIDLLEPAAAMAKARVELRRATIEELDLVARYKRIFDQSTHPETRAKALQKLRYYKSHPVGSRPFEPSVYWAGFVLLGC
jgi:CHAT domain-containing protein